MSLLINEHSKVIQDDTGYNMRMEEIMYNQIHLKWGNYINPSEKVLSFQSNTSSIVSHFQIHDSAIGPIRESLATREFVIHREGPGDYDVLVAPTQPDRPRRFFELIMTDSFFDNLLTEESDFLAHPPVGHEATALMASMAPGMNRIIEEMRQAPYKGCLKGMYLEAKAVELFLMQVDQLGRLRSRAGGASGSTRQDPGGASGSTRLGSGPASAARSHDIEALHAVRQYMDLHYDQSCSILELSRKVGINQMKLKTGFKELFQTTVFGYLSDLRMEEAKRLLLDEHLSVAEVADKVGYKHPHHFTVAFKKKFGLTPSHLKSSNLY
jgi:AraC-like DNA-binding protein